ncbi:DMT family transporter [Chelativorans sp. J32]|uniref:DMT family transporter n=1 Tax=Chelativorans sp. J32 TaxID=935840 RepID=UPI0004B30987|nr:DMT family transporter [Chelativorans sp. J32]
MKIATDRQPSGRGQSNAESAAPASAIGLIFGSGLLFSCLDAGAKFLVTSGIEAPFVTWVRYLTHLLLVLLLLRAWSNRRVFAVGSVPLQILRSAFLFGSTIFNFIALQTLQLAETVSIAFFAPMLTTALAGPLLGEWAGWRRWAAILVGLVGVLVVTRPGFGTFGIGHIFALCSMTCNASYVIMTRRMSTTETAESMIFYSALLPVILMLPAVPLYASMPTGPLQWAVILSLGFFGGMGHWLLILAYRKATTTALAPYPYLQIVWMIGFGYLFFDQLPDALTLTGAAIIVASGLYIVHREHRLRLATRSLPTAETETLAKKL